MGRIDERALFEAGLAFGESPAESAADDLLRHFEKAVLQEALGGSTGKAAFSMDGSLAAGLAEYLVYPGAGQRTEVSVTTLEDCCARVGCVPNYIKMDIEGAEIEVIRSSLDFLRRHPIHFAIESYHRTKEGDLTCHELERLLRSIGYRAESSAVFGQMFTWGTPPA